MTPASARIVALRGMRDVPELREAASRERLAALRSLLRLGSSSRLTPIDRGVLNLTLAEVDRVAGKRAAAVRRLETAREQLNSSKSGFFLPEWWRAVDRIGEAPNGVSPFRDAKRFEAKFADYPMLCAVFLLERLEEAAPADRQKAKQLLEHADALLMSAPEEETQWHARLLQLRAQLAFRSEALRWAGYVGTAASIFLALGDALRARTARPAVEEEPLSEIENRRARITVELEPDGLRVDALVPPGVSTSEQHSGGRAARLIQAWVGRGRRKSAFELEDWWADDPVGAAKEFGALLFSSGALEALRSSPPATEVRLELEGGRLNFVPWELVRAPDTGALVALEPAVGPIARAVSNDAATREEVRFLQLALNRLLDGDLIVDGMFGPKSGGLLRRYQEHRGVEPDGIVREDLLGVIQGDLAGSVSTPGQPPLVILVQPSAARQIEGTRGMLNLGVCTRHTDSRSGRSRARASTRCVERSTIRSRPGTCPRFCTFPVVCVNLVAPSHSPSRPESGTPRHWEVLGTRTSFRLQQSTTSYGCLRVTRTGRSSSLTSIDRLASRKRSASCCCVTPSPAISSRSGAARRSLRPAWSVMQVRIRTRRSLACLLRARVSERPVCRSGVKPACLQLLSKTSNGRCHSLVLRSSPTFHGCVR
jgi:peptidoglycan hydrolase-like protein with peptidoglycan-binding domain